MRSDAFLGYLLGVAALAVLPAVVADTTTTSTRTITVRSTVSTTTTVTSTSKSTTVITLPVTSTAKSTTVVTLPVTSTSKSTIISTQTFTSTAKTTVPASSAAQGGTLTQTSYNATTTVFATQTLTQYNATTTVSASSAATCTSDPPSVSIPFRNGFECADALAGWSLQLSFQQVTYNVYPFGGYNGSASALSISASKKSPDDPDNFYGYMVTPSYKLGMGQRYRISFAIRRVASATTASWGLSNGPNQENVYEYMHPIEQGGWNTFSYDFIAHSTTDQLYFRFASQGHPDNQAAIFLLDNVSVTLLDATNYDNAVSVRKGPNVVSNPDFAGQTLSPWTSDYHPNMVASFVTPGYNGASSALQINNTYIPISRYDLFQNVTLTAGDVYQMAFAYKTNTTGHDNICFDDNDPDSCTEQGNFRITMTPYLGHIMSTDPTHGLTNDPGIKAGKLQNFDYPAPQKDTWTYVTRAFVASGSGRIQLIVSGNTQKISFTIGGVSIARLTPA